MKFRILVVDDETEIRDMLSRHFRYLGYDVDTAGDGEEALKKMREAKFDIVISDIMMPGMDGTDLLRSINSEHPMTHVIMITGYVTLNNALTCMRLGADTIVFKPIEDLGKLEEAVENATKTIKKWLEILNELRKMKPSEAPV